MAGEIPAPGIPLPGGGLPTAGGGGGRLGLSQGNSGSAEPGGRGPVDGGLGGVGPGDIAGVLDGTGGDECEADEGALEAMGDLVGGWVLVVVQGRLLRFPVPPGSQL